MSATPRALGPAAVLVLPRAFRNAAAIRRVLERSPTSSHVYDDDFTPLGYVLHGDQGAWRCGRGLVVKLVLDAPPGRGAHACGGFTSSSSPSTARTESARAEGALELVKLLLAAGAGARDRGVLSGACEVACSVGHVMCCRTLLEARAAPTSACVRGAIVPGGTATGAREPAEERRMPDELRAVVVRMLLQAGADANECADAPGGLTLLMVACAYGRARCARERCAAAPSEPRTARAAADGACGHATTSTAPRSWRRRRGPGGGLCTRRAVATSARLAPPSGGVPAHAGGNHAERGVPRRPRRTCASSTRARPMAWRDGGRATRSRSRSSARPRSTRLSCRSARCEPIRGAQASGFAAATRVRPRICVPPDGRRRGARAVVLPLMEAAPSGPGTSLLRRTLRRRSSRHTQRQVSRVAAILGPFAAAACGSAHSRADA